MVCWAEVFLHITKIHLSAERLDGTDGKGSRKRYLLLLILEFKGFERGLHEYWKVVSSSLGTSKARLIPILIFPEIGSYLMLKHGLLYLFLLLTQLSKSKCKCLLSPLTLKARAAQNNSTNSLISRNSQCAVSPIFAHTNFRNHTKRKYMAPPTRYCYSSSRFTVFCSN